jgi:hypothetical protein
MKRQISSFIGMLLISCLLVLVTTTLVSAHSTQSSQNKDGCAHLLVHLHSNKLATATCLDTGKSSSGVTPFTTTTGCNTNSLELYVDSTAINITASICFIGTGYANMSDYYGPWYAPFNWNDTANRYRTGCNSGTFYKDSNGNGTAQPFSSNQAHTFDGQSGRLPIYTLSSLRIVTSC